MRSEFNFYGIQIGLAGPEEIVIKIKKDFSWFISDLPQQCAYNISLEKVVPDCRVIKDKSLAVLCHPEFIMYEDKSVKYIDYNGSGLAVSSDNGSVRIISENPDFLHEITYLTVLSFAGNQLEKIGFFRIHALGLEYNKQGFIIMAPSGGGKTTLMLNIIKDRDINFYGDDVVLIDKDLKLQPFPLRVGIKEESYIKENSIPDKYVYKMTRRKYGEKNLIDLSYFKEKIAAPSPARFIFVGKRWASEECVIEKAGKMQAGVELFKNLVIGVGLPQVLEYLNVDFKAKSFIILLMKTIKRFFMLCRLIAKCRCHIIYLGRDYKKNSSVFSEFIKNCNG